MAELKPITTSRFYVSFTGLENKLIKSVQEVSFSGQTKGGEKPLASTKGGKTLWQASSTGFEENPNVTIEVFVREGDMDFYNWYKATMPTSEEGGGKWAENRKTGAIEAFGPDDSVVMSWKLEKAWIKSYKVSDFASDGSDFVVETYEIVCEDIRRTK